MRNLLPLLIVICLTLRTSSGATNEEAEPEDEKLAVLRKKSTETPLWEVNSNEFRDYIATGPRNYSVVVLFTSETDQLVCPPCGTVRMELSKVASWYNQKSSPHRRDLFFVSVDYSKSRDVFIKYSGKINQIPTILRLPPTEKTGSTQFKWKNDDQWKAEEPTSRNLALWINKQLGSIKIVEPEPNYLFQYSVVALVLFSLLRNVYQHYQKPQFYLVICLVIPWFVFTGTIWNFNRNPPFVWRSASSWFIIYPGQRMQTVAEGLLVATLIMILSGLVCLVNYYVTALKEKAEQRQAFYMIAIVFAALFFSLQVIFMRKTPGYFVYYS